MRRTPCLEQILCVSSLLALGVAPAYAGDDAPKTVHDLAYGEVLFYFYQGDYLTALTRLLAAQQRNELPSDHDDAELLLGGLYLSYGEHRLAGQIFERVLEQSVDSEVHDRAWFFLAKIWHQRGYLAEADAALSRIHGELPDELEPERLMLAAEVKMALGRFDEALALLEGWKRPRDEWLGYAKFNIGVALVRLGRVEEGAAVLAEVGRLDPDNRALDALRDKANVALGYAWLQASRPVEAKPALQLVSLEGPYSNKALLGVGWADAEQGDYRAALAPWMELHGRDLLDSAVQESLLAVPYAFAELGADKQAADRYVEAIAEYEAEIERLNTSIGAVEDGSLIASLLEHGSAGAGGWYWRLESVPDSTESRYLYDLMATDRFQEGLKSYRDLVQLTERLSAWADSLAVFDDILDTKQRAYAARLPTVDATLAGLDTQAMTWRHVELESRLRSIESQRDAVALATPEQQTLWRDLEALEPKLERIAGEPRAPELAEKQRFLKGLLFWDLWKEYPARLWNERKQLIELDGQIEDVAARQSRIQQERDEWPAKFASLSSRIESLTPRVQALLAATDDLRRRQEADLKRVAVDELTAKRDRLGTYRVQARFALATLYDRAAASADTQARAVPGEAQP